MWEGVPAGPPPPPLYIVRSFWPPCPAACCWLLGPSQLAVETVVRVRVCLCVYVCLCVTMFYLFICLVIVCLGDYMN